MRLIDADALDKKLEDLMIRYHALGRKRVVEDYNFVRTFLSTAPTIDAVEVVRCSQCKCWQYIERGYGDCTHERFRIEGHCNPTMKADDFCCLGERLHKKDGE